MIVAEYEIVDSIIGEVLQFHNQAAEVVTIEPKQALEETLLEGTIQRAHRRGKPARKLLPHKPVFLETGVQRLQHRRPGPEHSCEARSACRGIGLPSLPKEHHPIEGWRAKATYRDYSRVGPAFGVRIVDEAGIVRPLDNEVEVGAQ